MIIKLSFLIYDNRSAKMKSIVTKWKGIDSNKISYRFLYVKYYHVWFKLYDGQYLRYTLR